MKANRRPLFGLLLVLIGAIILLDNLNMIPGLPYWLFSWVNIFLLIAVLNLVSGRLKGAFIFACLWGFFFLERFFYLDMGDYWPVILIIIGATFLIKRKSNAVEGASEDYFDDISIFGGSKKQFTSQQLKGGRSTSIFGGSHIDLRHSQLEDGATIDVFAMFGGVNIVVPTDWNVQVDVTAILGGFDDKRIGVPSTNGKTLYIKGTVLLGGGELSSSS